MLPEQFGCDLLFSTPFGWAGIQRKETKDLVASITDGRLSEQILRMDSGLAFKMVVVEGAFRWTLDGELVDNWARLNRSSLRKILWTIRARGVWIDWTDSLTDTITLVCAFEQWARRRDHKSVGGRPAAKSMWGKADNRDYQLHLLQGFPGVGPETAARILDGIGMPIGLKDGAVEQLATIKGVGPKTIQRITEALGETE